MRTRSDTSTVIGWLETWQSHINARNYDSARELFDPAVIGYGTKTTRASGLDELVERQWSQTWPVIENFRFDLDDLTVIEDADVVAAFTTWSSLGIRPDGSRFDRGGRMTLILRRDHASESLKATHTHFSLVPAPA